MDDWPRVATHNGERGVPPEAALAVLANYASTCGWDLTSTTVGQQLTTTSCQLQGPSGTSSLGRGKGVGMQSAASAAFEAVEHFAHKHENALSKRSARTFRMSQTWSEGSPDLALLFAGREDVPLSCLRYDSLRPGDDEPLDVPIILTNPAFVSIDRVEEDFVSRCGIYRYGTNSGTAAGLTRSEALLHGLLEVIERDALSITFVDCVLRAKPKQARAVLRESLPSQLRELLAAVEDESGGTVQMWDVTSDLDIPAFLCSLTAGRYRFFGSGASLSAAYAAERAALESLQGHHIHTVLGPPLQQPPSRSASSMTLYQRCGLDAGYFEYRGGEVAVEFDAREAEAGSPEHQLDELISRLMRKNVRCYARDILDEAVKVTQVVAPRLERLYLICHGIAIAPSHRARAAATQEQ